MYILLHTTLVYISCTYLHKQVGIHIYSHTSMYTHLAVAIHLSAYLPIYIFGSTEMFHLKYLQPDELWQVQSKHLTDPCLKLYKTLVGMST